MHAESEEQHRRGHQSGGIGWAATPASASATPAPQAMGQDMWSRGGTPGTGIQVTHPQHQQQLQQQQHRQQHQHQQQSQLKQQHHAAQLAQVVEQLERELSRSESSERRLTQDLDGARTDVEQRDQQIADLCAQWERSVGQLHAAREEEVGQLRHRLRHVEAGLWHSRV